MSHHVCNALQFHPGAGVGQGKDYTLFALSEGVVVFKANARVKTVCATSMAALFAIGPSLCKHLCHLLHASVLSCEWPAWVVQAVLASPAGVLPP
jgi:hypothetical protein